MPKLNNGMNWQIHAMNVIFMLTMHVLRADNKALESGELEKPEQGPVSQGEPDWIVAQELNELDSKFKKELVELQKLPKLLLNQYLEQLHLAKVEYQQAGNLKAALAFEQEIEEVKPKELGKRTEWCMPEDPIISTKRQEYITKHTAIVSRNYDASIALARGYADKLNTLIRERTKAGKLQDAQVFQSRLDELATVVKIYRQLDKSVNEMSSWVKETLEQMPERPQSAGGALPKLALVGQKAGEIRKMRLAENVSMELCWCPPGEFVMGSPTTQQGRRSNENQIYVKITKGFWMGRFEVTQQQWKAVMGRNPSHFTGDQLPVEQVSWNDVREFLLKLNQRIGADGASKVVLPTEAQWEYACLAGQKGPYSGGTIDEVAWYSQNSRNKSQIVGTKKPNPWNIHDMHGNVWEWCSNWYESKLSGGVDPVGPALGTDRVFRGGTWMNIAASCRASCRYGMTPTYKSNDVGFRVARISVF